MKYINSYKIFEKRVPRSERVQLYKDDSVIIVKPLTHLALMKYAHNCKWCINWDTYEWEEYHQGKSIIIIQRKPLPVKIGRSGKPKHEELFILLKLEDGSHDLDYCNQVLEMEFEEESEALEYLNTLKTNIANYDMNTVLVTCNGTIWDKGNNELTDLGFTLDDIPNMNEQIKNICENLNC